MESESILSSPVKLLSESLLVIERKPNLDVVNELSAVKFANKGFPVIPRVPQIKLNELSPVRLVRAGLFRI